MTKVFENPDDIKTRKLLVNTFISEIIWYGDRLIITYNFQENVIPERLTKSHIEEVEKQIVEATQFASSFSLCSSKFRRSAPANPLPSAKGFCFPPQIVFQLKMRTRTMSGSHYIFLFSIQFILLLYRRYTPLP